jgi:TonB-linked SusC/RagA family outer membrane protein
MKTKEVAITGNIVDVTLEEDVSILDEVVVIGYGTTKRRDLTGAVSSIGAKDLQSVPVSTVNEALAGKMAGVQVSTTEGSPDAEIIIRVRGGGSITQDNSPLYIVDGFPVSSISDISIADIESIDVLKDASSTAIYGSRGANGVVIVTTKGAKEGKFSVNYNAYYGVKNLAKKMDVLSPYDYALWQYERSLLAEKPKNYTNFFGNYQDVDMYKNIPGNDWQDITFGRTGNTFNQSVNVSGGSDALKFAFSYSHIDEKAIMQMSDFKRDNLSLKVNSKPHKRVNLGFSARWSQTDINGSGVTEQNQKSSADSRLKHAVIYSPIPVPNLGADNDDFDPSSWLTNPIESLRENDRYQKRSTLNLNGDLTWEVVDNLKLKTEVGLDLYNYNDNRFYGSITYTAKNNGDYPSQPMLLMEKNQTNTIRNTNTLFYDFKKILPQTHHLNLLLGQEIFVAQKESLEAWLQGFDQSFDLDQATKLAGNGIPQSTANTFPPDNKMASFFGRANYDYEGRYLLSGTFRADGSSKFTRGNRWGYFPSASAAWRISDEKFMEAIHNWLYDLKLRASYGTAGNNNIPSGVTEQVYTPVTGNALTWVNGYEALWNPSKTMANATLKWETTVTRNIGLDFAFLKSGALNGSLEVYRNTTKDLLILFPTGGGYDNQYRNIGKTQNEGIEVNLNWAAIDKNNYGLNFNFNIGFNKGKILDLGGLETMTGDIVSTGWASTEIGQDYIVKVGGVVGEMYGYVSDGRYEVSDFTWTGSGWELNKDVVDCSEVIGSLRPGSMKLKDIEGNDKKVTTDDRKVIGNANPLHTGGFTINGRAYGFDLTVGLNWSYGNDVYNANKIEWTSTAEKYNSRNMIGIMADGNRWTNLDRETGELVNDPETLAAMNANTTMWSPYMKNMVFSDWAVEDASFLRLNNLTLGYTLPQTLLGKLHIQQLRFYATAYNVAVFTNYSGFDPEVSTRRKTPLTPGTDYSAYPKSRSFVFGLNLTF